MTTDITTLAYTRRLHSPGPPILAVNLPMAAAILRALGKTRRKCSLKDHLESITNPKYFIEERSSIFASPILILALGTPHMNATASVLPVDTSRPSRLIAPTTTAAPNSALTTASRKDGPLTTKRVSSA